MNNTMRAIGLLAIVAIASVAFAQQGQGRGGGMRLMGARGGGGPSALLMRQDVQTDLKLTDDQKKKLTELRAKQQEEMRKAFEGMRVGGGTPPDPEAMRDQMKVVQDKAEKDVNAILTTVQQKRLKEIFVQLQGNRAVLDEKVQDEIGLSDEQKEQIKGIQQKQMAAMTALSERMRNNEIDREQMQELRTKNDGILATELGKVLTAAQQAKLKEMGGAAFKATDRPTTGGTRRNG